ncbi:MAG: ABC transporter permease [Vicinamibacterales bacterium]
MSLIRDIVYAARLFARHRVALATALISLSIALGFCTATVAVANAWFYPRLGVAEPTSLAWVSAALESSDGLQHVFPYAGFEALRAGVPDKVAAFVPARGSLRTDDGLEKDDVALAFVSDQFFDLLGARPLLGQLPSKPAAANDIYSAVLSHDVWSRLFNGAPDVVGKTIWVRGKEFVVIGVTGPAFAGPSRLHRPAVWLSTAALPRQVGAVFPQILVRLETAGDKARFRDQAARSLESVRPFSSQPAGTIRVDVRGILVPTVDRRATSAMPAVWALTAAMMVVAIVNLAGFLVTVAASRQREIGVRLAIGARRTMVFRQLVTESLLVSAIGGLLGYLASQLFIPVFEWMIDIPLGVSLTPDIRTYSFLVVISLAAAILAGLAPIRYASRVKISAALNGDISSVHHFARPDRARSAFVGLQVAISVVTIVLSTLWTRGAERTREAEIGFDAQRLLVLRGRLVGGTWSNSDADGYWKQASTRIQEVPDVDGIALAQYVFGGGFERQKVRLPSGANLVLAKNRTSSSYFRTARIPVLAGRIYSDLDAETGASVVVVSAKAAKEIWGSPERALGATLSLVDKSEKPAVVIGVVDDVVSTSLLELSAPVGVVYRPLSNELLADAAMIIHVEQHSNEMKQRIEAALPTFDPQRTPRVMQLGNVVSQQVRLSQVPSRVARFAATVVLILSIVGLHGLVNLTVHQKVRDIAVRAALGADSMAIVRYAASSALKPVIWGLGAGVIGAFVAVQMTTALLFGVPEIDPQSLILSGGLLLLAGLIGIAAPTIRAVRIQPAAILKSST